MWPRLVTGAAQGHERSPVAELNATAVQHQNPTRRAAARSSRTRWGQGQAAQDPRHRENASAIPEQFWRKPHVNRRRPDTEYLLSQKTVRNRGVGSSLIWSDTAFYRRPKPGAADPAGLSAGRLCRGA